MDTVVALMISIRVAVLSEGWEEVVVASVEEVSVEAQEAEASVVSEEVDSEAEELEDRGRRMPIVIAMTISIREHSFLISRDQDNNPWTLNSGHQTLNPEHNGNR